MPILPLPSPEVCTWYYLVVGAVNSGYVILQGFAVCGSTWVLIAMVCAVRCPSYICSSEEICQ